MWYGNERRLSGTQARCFHTWWQSNFRVWVHVCSVALTEKPEKAASSSLCSLFQEDNPNCKNPPGCCAKALKPQQNHCAAWVYWWSIDFTHSWNLHEPSHKPPAISASEQSNCKRLLLVDMKAVPVWVSWPWSEEMCHALNCTSHHKITRVALGADNEHFSWADSLRLRLMLLQSDQTPSELPGPARKDLLLLYSNIHFPLWSREPHYLVSAKQNFILEALNEDTNGHSHVWIFYWCFSS